MLKHRKQKGLGQWSLRFSLLVTERNIKNKLQTLIIIKRMLQVMRVL